MNYHGQIFIFSILKTFTEIVFVIVAFLPLTSFGQLNENFSDGDLTRDPPWSGNVSQFQITSSALQLAAEPTSTTAWISTPFVSDQNTIWEFSVTMAFNPSSSNYCRVFLTSDQSDLSAALNGYFVMIGNSTDEISLYRQTGTTRTRIIDGLDGRVNLDNVSVWVKITRNQD